MEKKEQFKQELIELLLKYQADLGMKETKLEWSHYDHYNEVVVWFKGDNKELNLGEGIYNYER